MSLKQISNGQFVLLCHWCGEDTTHLSGEMRCADPGDSYTGNPLDRRGAWLELLYWCECCGNKSVLAISGHKGGTYLGTADPLDTISGAPTPAGVPSALYRFKGYQFGDQDQ